MEESQENIRNFSFRFSELDLASRSSSRQITHARKALKRGKRVHKILREVFKIYVDVINRVFKVPSHAKEYIRFFMGFNLRVKKGLHQGLSIGNCCRR